MEITFSSNRKMTRFNAFLFLAVCIPLAIWGLSYVPSKIFIPQDAKVTAGNLLSNEFIFRTSIIAHLLSTVVFVFIILSFHKIFKTVDKDLSRVMVVSIIAQIPIVLILEVLKFSALMVLKSDARQNFDLLQQQEVSYLLLCIHRCGIGIAQLLFGLCFIPFGMLVFKSGTVPRVFGIFLIVSGVGYVADCLTYVLLQRSDYIAVRPFVTITFAGFVLTMLWFLIMGLREKAKLDISTS